MNKQTFYTIEVRSNITEYVGQWDELHKLPDYALHFDETEISETLNRIAEKYPTCKVVAMPVIDSPKSDNHE